MYPLSDLRVLILEENNLVELTVNSLHKNMPTVPYTVVPCEPGNRFPTTFKNLKGITLVLRSGVVVNKAVEIPDKVVDFALCVSRRAVYIDDDRIKNHYPLIDKNITDGLLDLSVFLVNPEKWDSIPESDRGVLKDKKLLYMSRVMNHKDDVLFSEEAVATIDALHYGMEGEDAFIYNQLRLAVGSTSPTDQKEFLLNGGKFEDINGNIISEGDRRWNDILTEIIEAEALYLKGLKNHKEATKVKINQDIYETLNPLIGEVDINKVIRAQQEVKDRI